MRSSKKGSGGTRSFIPECAPLTFLRCSPLPCYVRGMGKSLRFLHVLLFSVAFSSWGIAAERHIVLLSTNDIHGGVEPTVEKDGASVGGFALWSSVAKAIQRGVLAGDPINSGVLLLDAGDQFQGTLISNYDEGQLVFQIMSEMGYDAAIPGNHDYDFGPIGWLVDKSDDPLKKREALERVAHQAKFPLIAANTFYKNSLKDVLGGAVGPVSGNRCKPSDPSIAIDWNSGTRPLFLQPWLIKYVAGVRVAIIGLDNPVTPEITTQEDVDDLCFGDEFEVYSAVRKSLASQADIFVLLVHDGNTGNDHSLSQVVSRIAKLPGGGVDVVISGHTHYTYKETVEGIPLIQSGSGGERFGRIDLVWDPSQKKLVREKTKSYAGIRLYPDRCDTGTELFCKANANGTVVYEGIPVTPDPVVMNQIAAARAVIRPLADRIIGVADKEITRDRVLESPLADAMSDALRDSSHAEIAFINTSGLRASLPEGSVNYENLFKVLPFNNHEVIVGPMAASTILALLERSARSCGAYGPLMQSGLRVRFQHHCTASGPSVDVNAQILHIETLSGEVIYDAGKPLSTRSFQVATFDFLSDGGSGFSDFIGVPMVSDLGVARENFTTSFLSRQAHWTGATDGRWKAIDTDEKNPQHASQ